MKISKRRIRQIIKEEYESLMAESAGGGINASPEQMEAAEDLADSDIGKMVFAKLDKDPQVQAALEALMSQQQAPAQNVPVTEGEDYRNRAIGGVVSGGIAGNAALNALISAAAAGKVAAAAGPILAALGAAAPAIAIPLVVGYLADKYLNQQEIQENRSRLRKIIRKNTK